jgi:hypothetical protein
MEVFSFLIKLNDILGMIEGDFDAIFYSGIFSVDVIIPLLFAVKQVGNTFLIDYFLIFAVCEYIEFLL